MLNHFAIRVLFIEEADSTPETATVITTPLGIK